MAQASSKRKVPTQMLNAQRIRVSHRANDEQEGQPPPGWEKKGTRKPSYDVHNKPTVPINLKAHNAEHLRQINPFEKSEADTDDLSPADKLLTPTTKDPNALLEESSPLIMNHRPLDQASFWTIAPFTVSKDHVLAAWIDGTTLHLRDERAKHHAINLSERKVSAICHDSTYTWFATEKGQLFCFDRYQNKLTLAHELTRPEPIVFIHSDIQNNLLVLTTRKGKIYQGTPQQPKNIRRSGRTIPETISCGAFNHHHNELLLATTSDSLIRVPLKPGLPPGGSPIQLEKPATTLLFAPDKELIYVHIAEDAALHTYRLGVTSRRLCIAKLPSPSCHVYLSNTAPHARLLFTRGNVLFQSEIL